MVLDITSPQLPYQMYPHPLLSRWASVIQELRRVAADIILSFVDILSHFTTFWLADLFAIWSSYFSFWVSSIFVGLWDIPRPRSTPTALYCVREPPGNLGRGWWGLWIRTPGWGARVRVSVPVLANWFCTAQQWQIPSRGTAREDGWPHTKSRPVQFQMHVLLGRG